MIDKCKKVVIISATHEVMENDITKLNVERNKEIEVRNEISRKLAKEYNLIYIDLYNFMLKMRHIYFHTDYVHFEHEADEVMATYIYRTICGENWSQNKEEDLINKFTCKNYIRTMYDMEQIIKQTRKIVLYGAGKIGRNVQQYIESRGKRVECFVISDDQEFEENVNCSLHVHHVKDVKDLIEKSNVIVCMSSNEVSKELCNKGYRHFVVSSKVIDFIQTYVRIYKDY